MITIGVKTNHSVRMDFFAIRQFNVVSSYSKTERAVMGWVTKLVSRAGAIPRVCAVSRDKTAVG